MSNPGKFIAFEGLDGSGKSTQAEFLARRLRNAGYSCVMTCEPTDSVIGTLIRDHMTQIADFNEETVAALFVADRLNHVLNKKDGILRILKDGVTVISDRYYFSSYAYHSVYVPMDWVIKANSLAAQVLRPDLNIFLDVPPAICMERVSVTRQNLQRYECEKRLESVRDNYEKAFEKLAKKESILRVNGAMSSSEVLDEIWEAVTELFVGEHSLRNAET